MPRAIALIPAHPHHSALGGPSFLGEIFAPGTRHAAPVLAHACQRAARISNIERVVVVHPGDERSRATVAAALARHNFAKPVDTFAGDAGWDDATAVMFRRARRFTPQAWRGGVGGCCVFDELLPTGPLADAAEHHRADAVVLLGPDWPLLDPDICSDVLAIHLDAAQAMKLTFSQAPPGLAGCALSAATLREMAQNHAAFGPILRFDPRRPAVDPIGRDVCFQVHAEVRSCAQRFVYDLPRARARLDAVALQLSNQLPNADALTVTRAASGGVSGGVSDDACGLASFLPPWVTLELTPRRPVAGPITPQHHVTFTRNDLDLNTARRIIDELTQPAAGQDICLTLGGLGDPLLHPHWQDIVDYAHQRGIFALHLETDLLCDPEAVDALIESPIEVVSVRLNADTAATYAKVMGVDRFDEAIRNVERLFNQRTARAQARRGPFGSALLPWIVPRFTKIADNLADLEEFFNRWMHYAGHAVIDAATTGVGLMPALSPVPMAPPKRHPCRQLANRLTILSSGAIAQCDQDWQGAAAPAPPQAEGFSPGYPPENPAASSLTAAVTELRRRHTLHDAGRWNEVPLCKDCHEWHRP
jgi:hypothetical protein